MEKELERLRKKVNNLVAQNKRVRKQNRYLKAENLIHMIEKVRLQEEILDKDRLEFAEKTELSEFALNRW